MASAISGLQSLLLGTALGAYATSAQKVLIKGVSYGPVPLKSAAGASQLPADDWFCDEAVDIWGRSGRGDLRIMRQLGANLVRLYGNNPDSDHTNFLDEALEEHLDVAPGMTDFPYYQNVNDNCKSTTDFNCFSQVRPLYLQNLHKGFLTPNKEYHASLKYMNIINEADLKMPPSATTGNFSFVEKMCRTIISAFDAMLDAEKEAGVTGHLINYTATFSYAICAGCESFNNTPALGQMAQLDDAMRNPAKYGYVPKNDITSAYEARFTHSFNTQNPATDLQHQFLDVYIERFPMTPVYIGEYHRVGANQTEDLDMILNLAKNNPLFLGISFFEFQVAYWKTGSEMDFGMFSLGDHMRANMTYFSKTYPIWCLMPVNSQESGMSLPSALAKAYGGPGIDTADLCAANPLGVPLDHNGYREIASQQSTPQMERFVERLIHHLGASIRQGEASTLRAFADRFVGGGSAAFARMASELGSRPSWLEFDMDARCLADRGAEPAVIGAAIGWACSNSPSLNCSSLPEECEVDPYRIGDYVFSRYYQRHGDKSNPLLGCSFQGAAIFAPPEVFNTWTGAANCSEASTTTSTSTMTSTRTLTVTTSMVHHDLTTRKVDSASKPSFMSAGQLVTPRLSVTFSLLSLLFGFIN